MIYNVYGFNIKTTIKLIGYEEKETDDFDYLLFINDELKYWHTCEEFPYENPYSIVKQNNIIVSWRKNLTYRISRHDKTIEVYKEDFIPEIDYTLSLNYIMSIIGFINNFLPLHCACLEDRKGEITLLVGNSSVGKSTLTAGLLYKGWKYISEELTILKLSNHMVKPYGGSSFLRLNNKSLDVLSIDNKNLLLLKKETEKNLIWDKRWRKSEKNTNVCRVIYLSKSEKEYVKKLSREESISMLTKNIYSPKTIKQFTKSELMMRILKICKNLECFEYGFDEYPVPNYLEQYF